MKKLPGRIEMFCVLIVGVFTWEHVFVKSHWPAHSKWVCSIRVNYTSIKLIKANTEQQSTFSFKIQRGLIKLNTYMP